MNESLYSSWWLPANISTEGQKIDQMIMVLHYFMIALFVGWGLYLLYLLIAYRERPGHKANLVPTKFKFQKYIEIGVVGFEVFLLIFISYPIWAETKTNFPDPKTSTVVRIVGEQFAWNMHYPGPDGVFGQTKPELVDGTNPVGLDREDPAGKDDVISINNLHVVANKPTIAYLSSKDVLHSFFLPLARVKQDLVPGMVIPIHFTVNRAGEYEIACAQLCGVGHYRMRGQFIVDTPESFAAWMAEEQKSLNPESAGGSN